MSAIEEIIKSYNPKNINDNKAALREIVQSIVLVGLDILNTKYHIMPFLLWRFYISCQTRFLKRLFLR